MRYIGRVEKFRGKMIRRVYNYYWKRV